MREAPLPPRRRVEARDWLVGDPYQTDPDGEVHLEPIWSAVDGRLAMPGDLVDFIAWRADPS